MFSPFTKVLSSKTACDEDDCLFRGTAWKKVVTMTRDGESRDIFRPVLGRHADEDIVLSRPASL
jgi:hypothetical protein